MLIFSAPSGAGKTTIVRHLMTIPEFRLELSVSACTRPPRKGEVDGVDYYFISPEEFREKIAQEEFLEWEEVYENRYYGTLKSEVDRIWKKGHNVIFDVDVVGGLNIKKMYQDKALAVFIMPPTMEELARRLKSRSSDSKKDVETRLKKAAEEMKYSSEFDVELPNYNLEDAFKLVEKIVRKFLGIEQ